MAKVLVEQVAHTTHPRELTRNLEPEEGLSCHDDLDHRKVTRRPRLSVCPRRLSIALYFASYVVLDLCFVPVSPEQARLHWQSHVTRHLFLFKACTAFPRLFSSLLFRSFYSVCEFYGPFFYLRYDSTTSVADLGLWSA
jgi:hypothetical protein